MNRPPRPSTYDNPPCRSTSLVERIRIRLGLPEGARHSQIEDEIERLVAVDKAAAYTEAERGLREMAVEFIAKVQEFRDALERALREPPN